MKLRKPLFVYVGLKSTNKTRTIEGSNIKNAYMLWQRVSPFVAMVEQHLVVV